MVKTSTQKSSVKKKKFSSINSTQELKSLQKTFARIIMAPLKADDRMNADENTELMIQANDRLSSHERLELYARQYWWRVRDSIYEDFPGLQAVLGDQVFYRLMEEYLIKNPSKSFTLRNLGRNLHEFILKNSKLTKPYTQLAADVVALEWARIEGFDAAELSPITETTFVGRDPNSVKIALQPHISLVKLKYPANRFLAALRRKEAEGEASNTVVLLKKKKVRKVPKPRPKECYVIVHRHEGKIYYKDIDPMQFAILSNFQEPTTIEAALTKTRGITKINPKNIQKYFKDWTSFKWICERNAL